MGFGIKGYKGHATSDGVAFVVTVTEDGKPVAKVEQAGRGGCGLWRWLDVGAEVRFSAWVATLAPLPASEGLPEIEQDADCALEGLINEESDRKACRTKTLYRETPSDSRTFQIKAKFSSDVAAFIRGKHPGR